MKKSCHMAVQYEIDGKELAYILQVSDNENIVSIINRNNIKLMQFCGSFAEAGKVVTYWNECSRKNGMCAI